VHSNEQFHSQNANAQTTTDKRPEQPSVIATRRRCDAEGVGLSHYILMDRKIAQ
jgi:modified peptide precursor CbpA